MGHGVAGGEFAVSSVPPPRFSGVPKRGTVVDCGDGGDLWLRWRRGTGGASGASGGGGGVDAAGG